MNVLCTYALHRRCGRQGLQWAWPTCVVVQVQPRLPERCAALGQDTGPALVLVVWCMNWCGHLPKSFRRCVCGYLTIWLQLEQILNPVHTYVHIHT